MKHRTESERLRALDARNAREMGNAGPITADWPTAEDRRAQLRRWASWRVESALAEEVGA